ncbi:MAG: IS5 family transposase [Planctomycetota bacterium]
MRTSKSTLTVARMALKAAQHALAEYSHSKSPRKFTQPQLLACLIIKELRGLDYRGIHVLLSEWSDLRQILGLKKIPHFTTLCAASKRLLRKASAEALLRSILQQCRKAGLLKAKSKQAAIDSTGMETRHVSQYYTKRCKRHQGHYKRRFPKLTAICDTDNHLLLGMVIDRGPKLDYAEDEATVKNALSQQEFKILLADAGYESERFHKFCRDQLSIESIIPTTQRGRSRKDGTSKAVTGHYRKQMQNNFPKNVYGQRWQIETVFSMLKRNLGSALRARKYQGQNREIRLRVLCHNLMILRRLFYVLYRAGQSPIFLPVIQFLILSPNHPGHAWHF